MPRFQLRWLWLLLLLAPACVTKTHPAGDEQTAQEHLTPARLEAPGVERKLHLANLNLDDWQRKNVRGQGVKVAILDSGFRDYRQFLGNGLPRNVRTKSFRNDRNLEARDSQHGILCGEVIHAIAPDAEILLANWEPDSPQAFLDAVRWARNQGATIMSCSLIMPSWSDGEGGGDVHRGLAPLLDGVLFFASAGNTAQRHWCGLFSPNDAGWHQWRDDAVANLVTPAGKERVAVELYGPTQSSFELSVCDGASGHVIGRAVLETDGTRQAGRAVVRFEPNVDATYQVKVRCLEAPNSKWEAFHLVILGGSLEHATSRGSIPFPGDGAGVLAVGATDAKNQRMIYSSCGPNSRLPKPDFMATVPFPSQCRRTPFGGTSAAAPQAAGLAAVLWSSVPDCSARQLTQTLRQSAIDLGTPGHDHETGYGLIRLPPVK